MCNTGCGGNGQSPSTTEYSSTSGRTMSSKDKVIIEKAMITAESDWSSYKQVMTMLVDLKGPDKAVVRGDFDEYFKLADEYNGDSGTGDLDDIRDAILSCDRRRIEISQFTGPDEMFLWMVQANDFVRKVKIKEHKEVSKKLKNLQTQIVAVEQRIKARYL